MSVNDCLAVYDDPHLGMTAWSERDTARRTHSIADMILSHSCQNTPSTRGYATHRWFEQKRGKEGQKRAALMNARKVLELTALSRSAHHAAAPLPLHARCALCPCDTSSVSPLRLGLFVLPACLASSSHVGNCDEPSETLKLLARAQMDATLVYMHCASFVLAFRVFYISFNGFLSTHTIIIIIIIIISNSRAIYRHMAAPSPSCNPQE